MPRSLAGCWEGPVSPCPVTLPAPGRHRGQGAPSSRGEGLLCLPFSGPQCCGDEKWGDWRPHLAMVLSNLSHNVEVESRTMATMGDTLGGSGAGRAGPPRPRHPASGSGEAPGATRPPCLSSCEGPLGCRALLLPHGPGRVRGLHQEDHEARPDRLEPQVRRPVTVCFLWKETRPAPAHPPCARHAPLTCSETRETPFSTVYHF